MLDEFDLKAKTWDADPLKIERAKTVARGIISKIGLQPGMNALEYGCGTGLLSFELRPYLSHITLADTSEGMLEEVKDKIKGADIKNMTPAKLDLLKDPMPEEKYSLIYSLMTMHHIPDTPGIMRAYHTLLKPGGFLCIADLDKEDGSFHGEGFNVHNGFDRTELTEIASAEGFVSISFSDIFSIPRDVNGAKKYFPIFLMIAQKKERDEKSETFV